MKLKVKVMLMTAPRTGEFEQEWVKRRGRAGSARAPAEQRTSLVGCSDGLGRKNSWDRANRRGGVLESPVYSQNG